MKTDDPTIATLTIAGHQKQYRLVEWDTGSALLSLDTVAAVQQGQARIIAYRKGEIVRTARKQMAVWTAYGRD